MRILPAIDLLGGKCVRLIKGDYERVTVYSGSPGQMAKKWAGMGAEGLHVVDLDGAREGAPVNREAIRAIADEGGVPIEIGGGVRSVQTASDYLDLGASQVILGTAAIEDPNLVLAAADLFPERILVSVDVKDGKPATRGWIETVEDDPVALAEKFASMGAAGIVYTDISRDGMLAGPNLAGLRRFAESLDIPIVASGGVTTAEDIRAIKELEPLGVSSAIIGKALYDGAISLPDALAAAR